MFSAGQEPHSTLTICNMPVTSSRVRGLEGEAWVTWISASPRSQALHNAFKVCWMSEWMNGWMSDFNAWRQSNNNVSRGPKLQKIYGAFFLQTWLVKTKQNTKIKCIGKAKSVQSIFHIGYLTVFLFRKSQKKCLKRATGCPCWYPKHTLSLPTGLSCIA